MWTEPDAACAALMSLQREAATLGDRDAMIRCARALCVVGIKLDDFDLTAQAARTLVRWQPNWENVTSLACHLEEQGFLLAAARALDQAARLRDDAHSRKQAARLRATHARARAASGDLLLWSASVPSEEPPPAVLVTEGWRSHSDDRRFGWVGAGDHLLARRGYRLSLRSAAVADVWRYARESRACIESVDEDLLLGPRGEVFQPR